MRPRGVVLLQEMVLIADMEQTLDLQWRNNCLELFLLLLSFNRELLMVLFIFKKSLPDQPRALLAIYNTYGNHWWNRCIDLWLARKGINNCLALNAVDF